jgi:hypothetical protein
MRRSIPLRYGGLDVLLALHYSRMRASMGYSARIPTNFA